MVVGRPCLGNKQVKDPGSYIVSGATKNKQGPGAPGNFPKDCRHFAAPVIEALKSHSMHPKSEQVLK